MVGRPIKGGPDRNVKILEMFDEDASIQEIADKFELTRARVRQILDYKEKEKVKLLRIVFKVYARDWNPVGKVAHPYWYSGYGEDKDGTYNTLVSYANDFTYVKARWPSAVEIGQQEMADYVFSARFPRPQWMGQAPEREVSESRDGPFVSFGFGRKTTLYG